jgi:hypothetical protein
MPDSVISPVPVRLKPAVKPAVWTVAGIIGASAVGTILLWAHYGTAVFFEMIMAGLATCF